LTRFTNIIAKVIYLMTWL